MAIEIRYMYVQFWLRLKEESWDWIDWQESRGSTRKKNTGESERMKTRNEAKKKKKVLKSTKLGPENKNRDSS